MRTKGSAAELEARRRRRAAEYFQAGKSPAETATLVGVSLSSAKRWRTAWREGGVAALAAKRHPGPASKLSSEQKQELVEILDAGPLEVDFKTDLWTCARVAQVVRKKSCVSYHPDHLGRILHDLGYSPQKPRRVAREQDTEAVERWRKQDWPRIKKKPADVVPALHLSMKRAFVCNRLIARRGLLVARRLCSRRGIGTTV